MKTDYFKIPHNKHLGKSQKIGKFLNIVKENNMESIIKWHTGEPKERGSYIVPIKGLDANYVTCAVYVNETGWCHWKKEEIIAWCKLSDVRPYKEE